MQALQLDHRAENDQRLALRAANEAKDSDMGDTIRLDLADYEKYYIEEALNGFIGKTTLTPFPLTFFPY